MKKNNFSAWINLILLLTVLFVAVVPVAARSNENDDSLWGEVLNPDGSIRYDNLIDQGVQTESVDWIPSVDIFGTVIGGQAEYHVYETPDGTVVQLPTASTLLFMALNPAVSGMSGASDMHLTGAGTLLSMPGLVSAMLQGANVDFSGMGYVNANQYADALIAGDTDIWSLGAGDLLSIMSSLTQASITDMNLYTALLLYTPDNIPEELLELLEEIEPEDEEEPPVEPPACPAGSAALGVITTSGTLVAPNFPLVVGQDPDKRGVDLSFSVNVAPTIWTYYVQVPVYGNHCGRIDGAGYSNCTRPNGTPGVRREVITGFVCEQRTTVYPESIPVAYASATLSSDSRDWILNTLSIRYPGAYIHNGSFRYPSSSGGSSWSFERQGVQIQDPGTWLLNVGGRTSGTPVSDGRNFGGEAGSFEAYLKETAIIR